MKILRYELQEEVDHVDKPYQRQVTIDRVKQSDGDDKWAVRCGSEVLTKTGQWEYEPMPSNRSEAFLRRARFNSPFDAVKAWGKL
jgi:hypothetical protein